MSPPAEPATEAAAGRTVNVNLQASEDIDGLRQLVRVFDANSPSDDNAEARVTAGFARGLLAAFDALVGLVASTEQQRDEARNDYMAENINWTRMYEDHRTAVARAETAEQQRDEALAIVRGEQIETINESASRTLHATLDRAEAAERRAAETEAALEFVAGYADECAQSIERPTRTDFRAISAHARARAALSAGGPERTTT